MKKRYLECGRIVTVHGLRGEVRVQPWCDSPEYLLDFNRFYLQEEGRALEIERARVQKNMVLLKFAGIDSPDDAARLRGRILYLDREQAPAAQPDEYFVQDLLGLAVIDADTGEDYGRLSDVLVTGANDVYEITGADGRKRLIPAIRQVVLATDLEAGVMRIRPLKGLFDDAH